MSIHLHTAARLACRWGRGRGWGPVGVLVPSFTLNEASSTGGKLYIKDASGLQMADGQMEVSC